MKNTQVKPVSTEKKILIMGLDNGGKTSITLSLAGKRNLLDFFKIFPTKSFEIVKFEAGNTKFNIWDFGGQKTFRVDYIENFEKYAKGTEKVIFVIDIQDDRRYDLALDYMKQIVELFIEKNWEVEFTVFLHKFDPDLEKARPDLNDKILSKLSQKIINIVPAKFLSKISKTTIYTVFEKIDLS